jgi:hypothetical protein
VLIRDIRLIRVPYSLQFAQTLCKVARNARKQVFLPENRKYRIDKRKFRAARLLKHATATRCQSPQHSTKIDDSRFKQFSG